MTTEAFILSVIDKLAMKTNQKGPGITKEFAELWGAVRPHESKIYRYTRIATLARLSNFLTDLELSSFAPILPPFPKSDFVPYIFSELEIRKLFDNCDRLRIRHKNHESSLFSMPLLLRLLYSTGIRISEARALSLDSVNTVDGYLRIKDSKNGQERLIPISESLRSLCVEFKHQRTLLLRNKNPSDCFFVTYSGGRIGSGIYNWFHQCLDKMGLNCATANGYPRIHDLRHTFAVTSLAQMARQGVDMYASLPILSTYLGHQSIGATNSYIRLTAVMFPELIDKMTINHMDIFPTIK